MDLTSPRTIWRALKSRLLYSGQEQRERRLRDLFDEAWYREQVPKNPPVDEPLEHYLFNSEWYLATNPNPMFDTRWYLEKHPHLLTEKTNPLIHYLEVGEPAGHAPGPAFDPRWYLESNPDVAAAGMSPLAHYLKLGKTEGRLPKEPTQVRGREETQLQTSEALTRYLSDLKPSIDAQKCVVDWKLVPTVSAGGDLAFSGAVRRVFAAERNTCEGVVNLAYPGVGTVFEFHGAFAVAGTRYMVSPTGVIVHDEDAFFIDKDGAAIKYPLAHKSSVGGHLEISFGVRQAAWVEHGINIMHEYENNYFHFISETFPRMILAEEAGIPLNVPFLCSGDLHDNIQALFDLANFERRPVIKLERGTLYKVMRMYFPSDVTTIVDAYHGGPAARLSGLDVARIRKGVEHCKNRFYPRSPLRKRKIFVGRGGVSRRLLNQAKIEARLAEMGFEILRTDDMLLETQVRIFQEAEIVIGPTGAQMSNIVWCRPGTRVVVLASDHPSHQLYLWELLGRVSNAQVEYLQGPRAYVRNDIYSVHDDYEVDIEAVIAAASR